MGKRTIVCFLFIFSFIKPILQGQNFTVSGRIIHIETELPCISAAVSVIDKSYGALTDEQGWFEMKITQGIHTLHIKAGGYASKVIDLNVTADLNLGIIPLQPLVSEFGNVIGSYFLEDEWIPGHIDFIDNGEIKEDIRIKYRVDQYGFYIKKVQTGFAEFVPGDNIKMVTLYPFNKAQKFFINSNQYRTKNNSKDEKTFYEILIFGEVPLLRKTEAIYRRAKYQSSLGIGKDRDEILKKTSLFISVNDRVVEIPRKLNSFLSLLPKYKKQSEEFIKNNNLSVKKESDLKVFIQYYNNLIVTDNK